ncbi:MAG TPA: 50S ribosomal protein L2 [bacterium]|jgi:large subunit ribosomal protein L2|nr:50S ribosomal protein L2 [bacterium]
MPIKAYKPTSAGRRAMTAIVGENLTKKAPEKSLILPLKGTGGRNMYGRITSRHRGAGHKRQYRLIDFDREKAGMSAKVISLEYDPNRSSRIALLQYLDGEKKYILAPEGLLVGDQVLAGPGADVKPGHAMRLKDIPMGSMIHNVEIRPGKGGQLVRSAGAVAQLMARDGDYATIKLPSGEMRKIHVDCMASIGQVGNLDHNNVSIGKAGRMRWMGERPQSRGVVTRPGDGHPMGGGEGKTSGGRHPTTPWGKPTKGYKTRQNKLTDKYIVKRRK